MRISEQLLNEQYRFKNDAPINSSDDQLRARKEFLEKIHEKKKYISISKCPFCGNQSITKISEVTGRGSLPSSIVICNSCDGCFKSEILNEEANKFHYENLSYILRGKERTEGAIEKIFLERVELMAYPRYHFISNFVDLNSKKDLVLDMGCNDGANLVPWHENGFSVFGMDLDPKVIELGRKKGLNILCDDFLKYVPTTKPRLIILSHVLEHVSNVDVIFEKLRQVLDPQGYIFIEVPGIRSWGLGDPLAYFDVEHNYNFDLKSLSSLLKKYDLRPIYKDEYIRLICCRSAHTVQKKRHPPVLSLNQLKIMSLKYITYLLTLRRFRLHTLLKLAAQKNLFCRILNKCQNLYFKHYYLSFSKEN